MIADLLAWLTGGALQASGALVWTAPEGVRWAVVAACVAAFGLALVPGRGRGGPMGPRVLEAALWAAALAVLGLAAMGPRQIDQEGREESGPLVVLVDASASMAVQEGGRGRDAQARAVLERVSREAAGGGPVDVYAFDDALRSGAPAAFDGRGTDLGVALDAVQDRYLGQELRGVVVITDGLDRGALRRSLREAAAAGPVDPALAPPLPGPLTLYQVGRLEDVHDVAIDDVVTGGFAFLRTPFTLTARVRGPPGRTLPISLSREGRLVRQEDVTLDESGRGEVAFEVVPREVGRFAWQVSVPLDPDDAVPGNNAFPVVVRVVRDRTRVLQVSGSPSYDQKFLRLFLKEDPSVDLVSFFILRTREDMGAGWAPWELSLIEFPYERLFSEDLGSFDLVVLQNFDYAPYFLYDADELLGNIAQYVQDGGALVMTGGDRSFDLGDYQGTPLEAVLPVKVGVAGQKSDEVRFRPTLTEAGLQHPLTRLAADPEQSRALWEQLPAMDGLNITGGAAEGAAVLLQHPSLKSPNGQPAPVVAVREVARGRTMALTVDASWRWSFSEAAEGRGNQAYLRFWKSALRWLVADPDDRRVVVSPSRDNVLLGDEVQLRVLVRDAGYGPVSGAAIEGTVEAPDGSRTPFTVETDAAGEAVWPYRPDATGAHRVRVQRTTDVLQAGETVFAVSSRDPELSEIAPDPDFLRDLAALYGDKGAWRGPGDDAAPLMDDTAVRVVDDRREVDLASAPLVAVLFGLFATGAWVVRRRRGGH